CILFADTNVGKSILAVQIGDAISRGCTSPHVSKGDTRTLDVPPSLTVGPAHLGTQCGPQRVVYFDFELTDKQFESRVSRRVEGSDKYTDHYEFNDNFNRAEINPETRDLAGFKTFEEF